ncbi:hypothetical protein SPSIL_051690 [Sporomusa silvacetica DSM 10669]|uniref:PucR C-terminal helix-turn-helix domain-containing protein n=1 Tax=Sporomusa silvacetica DSM 10669 TaxID=1123289 RepID=A0ABZ3ITR7_9FIRM|nr:helix-turn-helix domain-containing protein [Sporomusa silvacetica]OZC19800.1 carbohydrate diacid transcriptional activator CdaR [Sporomusa silvacetica DSM 10669]
MISLAQILDETTPFLPHIMVYAKGFRSFFNLSFVTKGQLSFAEDTLYIGLASQIGELHSIENAVLLLVIDSDHLLTGVSFENTVIVGYPRETDSFQMFNKIKSLFYKEWDFLNYSVKLLDIFVKCDNLNSLVEMIASFVHNPVQIMHSSYKVLAYSKLCKGDDAPWNETNERGYFTYEYTSAIYRFNASSVIPKDNTPYYLKLDISPLRRLISKIYLNGVHLGYLVTLETNQTLGTLDKELYKLISNLCAKTIKSELKMLTHKGYENTEYLLIDLLEGAIANRSIYLNRIKNTNLNKSVLFQLISIDIEKYAHEDATDNFLKRSLKDIFPIPRVWSLYYHDRVVALIGVKSDDGISDTARRLLDNFFQENSLCAGVSDVFSDLYNLPLFYRQTTSALRISSLLQTDGTVFDYDDFKFYDMLLTVRNSENLKIDLNQYSCLTIMQIQAYDKKHGTDYFKTLWTYLNTDKNLTRTAQALYIHKNTAAYRINKLKQLFGIDMENNFALFKLYYSYLLLTCAEL